MESRNTYGVGLAVTGGVLTAVQLVQGVQQLQGMESLSGADQGLVFAFGTAPFVLVGLALVYVGYWLRDQPTDEEDLRQILAWGAGSTVLFASLGALLLFNQQVTVGTLAGGQYLVMDQVTVGAAVGVLVGIYDARSRERQRELRHERDRIEAFGGKAADINNYGRELSHTDSIEEVSALCIEGLQTLLGLTESGFVVIDGEDGDVVNSTIVNVRDETLVELATESSDREQATVKLREGTDLERDGRLLSIVVTQHEGSAVVLLAITDSDVSFEDEDIQLVELLVTHAGTALDRIHEHEQQSP